MLFMDDLLFYCRNLNAVVSHPKDIGIGPKIYTSIVQMTISRYLGMLLTSDILWGVNTNIARYLNAYVLIFGTLDAVFRPVAVKNHTEWSPD